ncbi:MAG TPA: response regulator, partial [Nitrospirota bacterium]
MSFSKKNILVVDGNKTNVLYMGIMLKRMGFNVVPADSGVEALKLMKLVTPDLMILDEGVQQADGYDTLVQVRRNWQTREVPVVMMTARSDDNFVKKCAGAGCNGFLPKPIPMDLLHEHIQDFIFAPLGFKRKHLRVQADIKVMLSFEGSFR